jgi:hypothetical protein
MVERQWRVRLGAAAEIDFANILKWTTENFGAAGPDSTGTRSFRRSANLATVPMLLGPRPETRSCEASARFMLRDAVVADVTSFCTG